MTKIVKFPLDGVIALPWEQCFIQWLTTVINVYLCRPVKIPCHFQTIRIYCIQGGYYIWVFCHHLM